MPPIKFTFSFHDALSSMLDEYLVEWSGTDPVPVNKMNLKGRAVNTDVFEEVEVVEWIKNY